MSEPKPTYEYSEGVLEAAIIEQIKEVHKKASGLKRRPGEFTIPEYAKVNECAYDSAKKYLIMLAQKGEVIGRKAGNRKFYRFPE